MHMNVHNRFICNNNKNLKQHKYPSVGERIICPYKYPYNGLLFSNKKAWAIDECYKMDEPQNKYIAWKKPDKKSTYCINPLI